jgi:hypothetical protein
MHGSVIPFVIIIWGQGHDIRESTGDGRSEAPDSEKINFEPQKSPTRQQHSIRKARVSRNTDQQYNSPPISYLLRWLETPYLHHSLPRPLTHNRTRILPIHDLPHALAGLGQLSYIIPGLSLEQPDTPVIPTSD